MTKLTQEQLQTIEDAFNSIPEPMRTGKFGTMEGIEEQLERGNKIVYYSDYRDVPSEYRSKICKMRVCE